MCDKRQIGDEYHCLRCRTRWDINDPEPPPCQAEQPRAPRTLTERMRALSRRLRVAALDVAIPAGMLNDLDDMIEEVKLLDDARRRDKVARNIKLFRPR